MKFGGIDWDNRHPETLDIEPGSCDFWTQMDKCYGTSPDSPLSHKNRHARGLCKPMDRTPKESIEKIEFWTYEDEEHVTVYYWDNNNMQAYICSCGDKF